MHNASYRHTYHPMHVRSCRHAIAITIPHRSHVWRHAVQRFIVLIAYISQCDVSFDAEYNGRIQYGTDVLQPGDDYLYGREAVYSYGPDEPVILNLNRAFGKYLYFSVSLENISI